MNNIDYVEIEEINNTETDTIRIVIENLNTNQGQHWFRIPSVDFCGNVSNSSLAHAPVYLNAKALSKSTLLNWNQYIGWQPVEYLIERKKANTSWRELAQVGHGITNYTDSIWVNYDSVYTYRITALGNNGRFSRSNEALVIAKDTIEPMAPVLEYVTIVSNNEGDFEYQVNWSNSVSDDVENIIVQRTTDTSDNWLNTEIQACSSNYTTTLHYETKHWYFRLLAVDNCGNVSSASKIHSPIHLRDTSINQAIAIGWTYYQRADSVTYNIYRNGVLIDSTKWNFYLDSPLTCTSSYEYQIMAKNRNLTTYSNKETNTAKDITAPEIPVVAWTGVTKNNDSIEISIVRPNDFDENGFNIYTLEGEKLNSDLLLDSIYAFASTDTTSRCFLVTSQDYRENENPKSLVTCTTVLNAQNDLFNNLEWNNYELWFDGVKEYEIYRKEDDEPWELVGITDGSVTKAIDSTNQKFESSDNVCYKVRAVANNHSEFIGAFSNTDCIVNKPIFYIPNAFTPNNNNQNEVFGPYGMFTENFEMTIFSRTGQKVFSTTENEYWKGEIGNGKPAVIDSYLYLITIKGYNGDVHELTGYVNVIR